MLTVSSLVGLAFCFQRFCFLQPVDLRRFGTCPPSPPSLHEGEFSVLNLMFISESCGDSRESTAMCSGALNRIQVVMRSFHCYLPASGTFQPCVSSLQNIAAQFQRIEIAGETSKALQEGRLCATRNNVSRQSDPESRLLWNTIAANTLINHFTSSDT